MSFLVFTGLFYRFNCGVGWVVLFWSRGCLLAYAMCYTLILDIKILLQISLLFSNTFKFTVFSTVHQLHTLLLLSFNFCMKSYKRVFWSFPTKEPIFSPCICFRVFFNLSVQIICQILYKTTDVCVWVSLSRFGPRGILVFSHYLILGQRGILKYLIFGSLYILVHFVNFNRFTLRCIQITFFNQFYYYCILVPILSKIAI